MAEKSKILIIGGTGYLGKFIVQASVKAGHPTFVLVRESTLSNPDKAKLVESFKSSGVTILHVRPSLPQNLTSISKLLSDVNLRFNLKPSLVLISFFVCCLFLNHRVISMTIRVWLRRSN